MDNPSTEGDVRVEKREGDRERAERQLRELTDRREGPVKNFTLFYAPLTRPCMVIPRPSVLSVRKPAKSSMLSAQLYV